MQESQDLSEDSQSYTLALGQASILHSVCSSPGDHNHLCRVQEETRGAAFAGCPAVGQGCMGMCDGPIQAPVAAGCAKARSSICMRAYTNKRIKIVETGKTSFW